jgi:hypothetical protein
MTEEEFIDDYLKHFGVKGMRWGVRREADVTTSVRLDQGVRRRRTKIVAKGGESHPAHTDAIKAAVQKRKLKKSGTDALSTDELRSLSNRLQLETQVQVLASPKGKKFVQRQIEQEGQKAVGRGVGKAAPFVAKKAKKGAATVATTAALAL